MQFEPSTPRLPIAQGSRSTAPVVSDSRTIQIFEIAELLGETGLATWMHPLLILLDSYAEIEVFAPNDDPLPAVQSLLQRYSLNGSPPRGGKFADDLCSLQILLYGAAWFTPGSTIPVLTWNPLQMTFRRFKALQGPHGNWKAWKDSVVNPSLDEVRRHLLANYVKVNGFV
ncbi:hypothetical protein V3C40_27380 [Janthinobacterium sp. LS2A]|uniref:hypothetical protein n=1 Tax=Janthinobacterium sp. LS2A TaxID=3118590 RepID=UPI002F9416DC